MIGAHHLWMRRRENMLSESFREYIPFCSLFFHFLSKSLFRCLSSSDAHLHSWEETPVNLAGSEFSVSGKMPLHIPKVSSNTQKALPLSLTFFSNALQIIHFYSLARSGPLSLTLSP